MITGAVTSSREAVVRFVVRGPHVHECEIGAIIDTGFNGYLTLPSTLITALRLAKLGRGRVLLGNGSEEVFDIYEAVVIWNGRPRSVEVDSADTDPLVGMALLDGHHLRIAVVPGGIVSIDALP
jgi:clan AA aspartic protease